MPISLRSFIDLLFPSVNAVAPSVVMKPNFIDDRIDAVLPTAVVPFMSRAEIDAVGFPQGYPGDFDGAALKSAATERAVSLQMSASERISHAQA